MAKLYPIGIQNFESLRKDRYFYIDKTKLVYELANTGRYYFLWEESAYFYFGSLFSRKEGVVSGLGYRAIGERLDEIPCFAFGS